MIRLMYSVFLGLTIVMFVGVGVQTFYSPPEQPDQDEELYIDEPSAADSEEIKQRQLEDRQIWDDYDHQMDGYNRNVAIVTMLVAIVLLVIAVTQAERLEAISEGVLLGGVFTLLYSMVRGLISGDDMARFAVISVGLVVALWLGKNRIVQGNPNLPQTSQVGRSKQKTK